MKYRIAWTVVTTERHVVVLEAESASEAAQAARFVEHAPVNIEREVRGPWALAEPNETETMLLAVQAHLESEGRVSVAEAIEWVRAGIIRPAEPEVEP